MTGVNETREFAAPADPSAPEALRAREAHQAFLLRLSDALRPLSDPAAIEGEACRLLGDALDTHRAWYAEFCGAEGYATVAQDYVRGDLPSLVGRYPLTVFGWAMELCEREPQIVVVDVRMSPLVPDEGRLAVLALQLVSWISIPLVKPGVVGTLNIGDVTPRRWTEAEVEMVREAAERIWDAVPPDVGSALYRITQEALNNKAKHAGAKQVSVILGRPNGEMRLIVEDDGSGFDVDVTAARVRAQRRLRLAGMRERAALVGGTIAIESSPGTGTTVQVRVPIRASTPDVQADGWAGRETAS